MALISLAIQHQDSYNTLTGREWNRFIANEWAARGHRRHDALNRRIDTMVTNRQGERARNAATEGTSTETASEYLTRLDEFIDEIWVPYRAAIDA